MYVRFKYPIRLLSINTYPATQPLNNVATPGKGEPFKLSDRWLEWIYAHNGEQEARYLLKEHSGWVNAWAGDGTPISESLTMGGNIGKVLQAENGGYWIDTLQPSSDFPGVGDNLLIHKFTCWNFFHNHPALPGTGLHIYYPFLTARPVWVSGKQVEVFASEPAPYWPGMTPSTIGFQAVMRAGAIVYQRPGEVKIRKVYVDELVWVSSEINGWAQIGDKRWVEETWIRRVP